MNPYLDLFYGALEAYGVQRAGSFLLSPRWLAAKRHEIHAIHLHWPEWLWDGRHERSGWALLKLHMVLVMAGVLGIKRIWTVHNLDPHEGRNWQDELGQRLLARYCDLLIVHSRVTEEQVRRKLSPKAPMVVMPHGSYEGHYPAPRPRAVVMEEFGLKGGRPILCCLGRLRDYKGLDLACEALSMLHDEVQLVIAGVPHRGFDMAALERYDEILPGLVLIARALDDQEFSDLLSVSDAALLPYRQITGSGALLAAWTHGCGVVVSDLDYFQEMLLPGNNAGMAFKAGDAESLVDAIRAYLKVPYNARERDALRMAERFSWSRCVEPVGEVIQAWQEDGEARGGLHRHQEATA